MLKKLKLIFLLVALTGLAFAQQLPPRSNTLVTDSTHTLSADDKARLESKLVAFDDSTSTQIAIVIINTVGNYDINQYGTALIRAWGIGEKDKNNGILILVALADRKVSIQTGYGAEGAVPDVVARYIINNDITPNFKQNKYYEGLDAATSSLIKQMKGEYKQDNKSKQQVNTNGNDEGNGGSVGIIVFIVIVILILIFRNRGGGGHIIGRRGGASPFWWFLMGSAMGGGSNNNSGGGFFGGGSSGGGGGFGGFGGGSSGGGGASGSW